MASPLLPFRPPTDEEFQGLIQKKLASEPVAWIMEHFDATQESSHAQLVEKLAHPTLPRQLQEYRGKVFTVVEALHRRGQKNLILFAMCQGWVHCSDGEVLERAFPPGDAGREAVFHLFSRVASQFWLQSWGTMSLQHQQLLQAQSRLEVQTRTIERLRKRVGEMDALLQAKTATGNAQKTKGEMLRRMVVAAAQTTIPRSSEMAVALRSTTPPRVLAPRPASPPPAPATEAPSAVPPPATPVGTTTMPPPPLPPRRLHRVRPQVQTTVPQTTVPQTTMPPRRAPGQGYMSLAEVLGQAPPSARRGAVLELTLVPVPTPAPAPILGSRQRPIDLTHEKSGGAGAGVSAPPPKPRGSKPLRVVKDPKRKSAAGRTSTGLIQPTAAMTVPLPIPPAPRASGGRRLTFDEVQAHAWTQAQREARRKAECQEREAPPPLHRPPVVLGRRMPTPKSAQHTENPDRPCRELEKRRRTRWGGERKSK